MSLLKPRTRKDQQSQPTTTSGGGNLPPITDRIIRNLKPDYELSQITGLKVSTIYKHAASGSFPPPVKITGRATGWRWSEVKQWINGKREWGNQQ